MLRGTKINWAIRNCLAGIYGQEAILARIEEFLDTQRAQGEFSEPEILMIESGVRHILYGMVYPNDATRKQTTVDPRTSKVAGV
jgi:hypothetical protein